MSIHMSNLQAAEAAHK